MIGGNLYVHNIGTMREPTGYAKANRHLMTELAKLGVHVRFTPVHPEGVKVNLEPEMEQAVSRFSDAPLPERHLALFHYPALHFIRDPRHFSVGMTMHECTRLPFSWVRRCNMMDEIWVPSSFNRQTFIASGVHPQKIRVMPYGVDTAMYRPGKPPLEPPGKRRYAFLSVCSFDGRKGIDILVQAFLEEFAETEDVSLIVKTRASAEPEIREQQSYIDRIALSVSGRRRDSVILISDTGSWTEERLSSLYNSVNGYVLPTRGEGWNLTVMEALAAGLPVITTNWSAHLDFMNDSNGYLIAVRGFAPARAENPRSLWAVPDKDHLKRLMRHVYTHPDEAAAKGQLGKELIREHFTWEKSAQRMLQRLQEIAGGRT